MSFPDGLSSCKCLTSPPVSCQLSGWNLTEYILFCNILWWVFYWFLLLVSKQTEEWCCRMLTLFHGVIICYLAISDIICNKHGVNFQMYPLSEDQKGYFSFMLSYFFYDFLWIHIFGNETWVIYFHHTSSILILLKVLNSDFGCIGFSYGVAGLEITNPYLQLRWFLRTHGYLNTPIHKTVELMFFALFFAVRVFGGSFLFYYMIMYSDADLGLKISVFSIYIVTLILAWQIFVYFKEKYWNVRIHVSHVPSRVSISPFFPKRSLGTGNHVNFNDDVNSDDEEPVNPQEPTVSHELKEETPHKLKEESPHELSEETPHELREETPDEQKEED